MNESFPMWPFAIVGATLIVSLLVAVYQIVKKTPYEQGMEACEDGMIITDNPYQTDEEYEKFKEWESGFLTEALHDV